MRHIETALASLLVAVLLPAAVFAGGPAEPLEDLVPGMLANDSSWPGRAFALGHGVAFPARDRRHGDELRLFDGHQVRLFQDLWPGRGGWPQTPMVPLGDYYYFRGHDGVLGSELWRTDPGGREFLPVVDLCPGACSGVRAGLPTAINGLIYFGGRDGAEVELWVSDGSAAGTRRVAEICPGPCASNPSRFTEHDGRAYFVATGPGGRELWVSDGTEAGTHQLFDPCDGCDGSPHSLTSWQGHLYFVGYEPGFERKLFRTDGSEAGTVPIASVPAHSLPPFGDRLYFLDSGASWKLWATDGTRTVPGWSPSCFPTARRPGSGTWWSPEGSCTYR